jgi:hypothetical protein
MTVKVSIQSNVQPKHLFAMEKKEFKITINAPKEKVWNILWNEKTYPEWTSVFSEGSRAETDWKKGSKVLFLDGANSGMVSTIVDNVPNQYMSIKHLGTIKDGVEEPDSEQTREWAGALENYTLKGTNGKTELTVDIDITPQFLEYFLKTFPKALEKIKELAEKK